MHSSEISTDEAFELAENWSSNLPPLVPESDRVPNPALDRITDPFSVVPDPTSASGTETNAPLTQAPVLTGTEGGAKIGKSPSREHTHYGSAEPVGVARKQQQMDSAWINTVGSQGSTVTSSEALHIPKIINLHKYGLRRSPCPKEKAATSGNKLKAHVTFGATITKVILLFTFFSNVKSLAPCMTSYELNPNSSFTTRAIIQLIQLMKLMHGTCGEG